jgi:glycerol-3-phosphate dehydrogenase
VLGRGKRNLFFVPWRGGTLVGTWYEPYAGDPDTCGLSPAEIGAAVREVNQMYPAWGLRADEVTMTHVGLVPAGAAGGGDADKHTRHLDERNGGSPGLVVIQGVKYTTGVVLGEALADRLVRLCSKSEAHAQGIRPPPVAARLVRADQVQDWCRGRGVVLPAELAAGLAQRYGSRFCQVLEVALASPELLAPIGVGVPVLAAEVRHAVRYELAVRLADVVLRRTGLGTQAAPSAAVLDACARLMAAELGWDARRQAEEISAVRHYYELHGVPGP